MNNSIYNMLTDFSRYMHLARLFRRSVAGANGGVYMRFKRSIAPFESFELRTRMIGVDEKWIFIEHRFFSRNRCKAAGLVKIALLGKDGKPISPKLELEKLGIKDVEECDAGRLICESEKYFGKDD